MVKTLTLAGTVKTFEDTTELHNLDISLPENFTELVHHTMILDASAADEAVNWGGVESGAVMVILIPTYASSGSPSEYLTANVNGGTDDIPIGKLLALGGHGAVGMDSLTLSNPDADNAVSVEVFICK